MTQQYKNPSPTVDVVIETNGGVVLIERANEPQGWALPGGFVDYGERVEDAARREAMEETGLQVELTHLLGIYSDPSRDPRQHTISTVYVGRAEGTPHGGDDAARAAIFSLDSLPSRLCFDHGKILDDYRQFRRSGRIPAPAPRSAEPQMLTHEEQQALLAAARDGLEAAVTRRPDRVQDVEQRGALGQPGAAFVTLYGTDGSLRGCIGGLEAIRPLAETVRAMAGAAALRDPRFPPVSPDELPRLRISLSVLTPSRLIRSDEIEVGRHGLLVERGGHRGVLLPQVASEQGWNAETFLEQTCVKAGLTKNAWRNPETRLYAFETENFKET